MDRATESSQDRLYPRLVQQAPDKLGQVASLLCCDQSKSAWFCTEELYDFCHFFERVKELKSGCRLA